MKRKEGLMAAALALTITLTGVGIQGTYSYFTHKEVVNNVFTVGELDVDLEEPEWDPEEGDGENIYPGYTVYKNPTVKNVETKNGKSQPCYLMMKVRALDGNGTLIKDEKRLAMIKEAIRYDASFTGGIDKKGTASGLVEGNKTGYPLEEIRKYPMVNPEFEELQSDTGEWTFGYKGSEGGVLKPNEEKTLFTTVVFPTEWTSEELESLGEFQLEISALAIQAEGFESRTEAFTALVDGQ